MYVNITDKRDDFVVGRNSVACVAWVGLGLACWSV